MNKPSIISVVELGSTKVSTLIAQILTDQQSLERKINIVGVSEVVSSGIKKGQIVDIEEAVEATIASVEAAERMAGYNLDKAYIALSGAHVASQNSHGVVAVSNPEGEINDSDVERAIEAASAISLPSSREIIHVLPCEFTVDGEKGVKDPVGMSGVRLEVETHIITASVAATKNLRKAINEVGIEITDLVFSGLASTYSVLSKTEKELGCVLVDIGGGTTSIVAYVDGAIVHSSVVPIGAKNITSDLAIGLRISLESAEKIKLKLSEIERNRNIKPDDEIPLKEIGVSEIKKVSRKTLVEGIIRPRLNEIFTMVRLQLERENIAAKIPSGVIITGGGAETVGVVDSAKRMMALPVRLGVPKGIDGLIDDILKPAYATTIGLAIYAASEEKPEGLTSFTKGFKLPTNGIVGKVINAIRDLLP